MTAEDMPCGSCGNRSLKIRDGRYVCTDCGWVNGLVDVYRQVSVDLAVAGLPGGSPIEVARCEEFRNVLAVHIADMFAAQPDRTAALV